jgi:hypothetical protein
MFARHNRMRPAALWTGAVAIRPWLAPVAAGWLFLYCADNTWWGGDKWVTQRLPSCRSFHSGSPSVSEDGGLP